MEYDNAMYRYVHNLQGDIVAIVDAAGNAVVEYKYDAWGKSQSNSDSESNTIGSLNPFRYKECVFDEETSQLYLETRYYSLEFNRFINSDIVFDFVATKSEEILNQNLYAYCRNNPVTGYDPLGLWSWNSLFKVVATAVVATAVVAATVATLGTAAAALVGAKVLCSTVDGALSAMAAGGEWYDGAFAGTVSGAAQVCAEACTAGPILGRAINSSVYDVVYECASTGTMNPENLAIYGFDVTMDCVLSTVNYSYTDGIGGGGENLTKTIVQGGIDSSIDVFQTVAYFN